MIHNFLLKNGIQARVEYIRNVIKYFKIVQFKRDNITIMDIINKAKELETKPELLSIKTENINCRPLIKVNNLGRSMVYITSKALVDSHGHAPVFHVDATFKILKLGYPVAVIGTTNMDRKFHLHGFGILPDEKTESWTWIIKRFAEYCRMFNKKANPGFQ